MAETLTVPSRPVLAVVPNVEILEVGEDWHASTGDVTFTADDLAAAVAAQDDPGLRSPVITLGHRDPRFSGEPAVGRLANLRTTNNGQTLVADLVGLPVWLAEIMASAFPSRSIEGAWNVTSSTGNTHPFVIDALALLGVSTPAIESLADVASLFGVEEVAAGGRSTSGTLVELRSRGSVPSVPPLRVEAATSVEDVRRAYYDELDAGQMWWWIREVQLDPAVLIVDDDEGGLWRVSYEIDGDEISFGEAEAVRVEYVNASAARRPAMVYASRGESRPEASVDLSELRSRLGLPDTATDEEVLAAAAAALPEHPPGDGENDDDGESDDSDDSDSTTSDQRDAGDAGDAGAGVGAGQTGTGANTVPSAPVPVPAGSTIPEGAVLVDAAAWQEVQRQAREGSNAATRLRREERDRFVSSVAASGRLAPSNEALRRSLEREWERDPVEAQRVAAQLAVVMPTSEVGGAFTPDDTASTDAGDLALFPELARARGDNRG